MACALTCTLSCTSLVSDYNMVETLLIVWYSNRCAIYLIVSQTRPYCFILLMHVWLRRLASTLLCESPFWISPYTHERNACMRSKVHGSSTKKIDKLLWRWNIYTVSLRVLNEEICKITHCKVQFSCISQVPMHRGRL